MKYEMFTNAQTCFNHKQCSLFRYVSYIYRLLTNCWQLSQYKNIMHHVMNLFKIPYLGISACVRVSAVCGWRVWSGLLSSDLLSGSSVVMGDSQSSGSSRTPPTHWHTGLAIQGDQWQDIMVILVLWSTEQLRSVCNMYLNTCGYIEHHSWQKNPQTI